jgi:hypothetical protein
LLSQPNKAVHRGECARIRIHVQQAAALEHTLPDITAPMLAEDASVWFSAFRFGWGYCAFELPAEVVCKELGAAQATASQLLMAFELGKRRIVEAAALQIRVESGERIQLSAADIQKVRAKVALA